MIKRLIKNCVLWLYWYPTRAFMNLLPSFLMYRAAAYCGDLHRVLSPKKQHCLQAEYQFLAEVASPEEPLDYAIRQSYVQHFQNDFEMFRYKFMTAENVDQYIICKGIEHLDHALAKQRGVMLTFGHLGANKMVMAAIGHRGYPMNQFSTPPTVWIEKRVDRDMRGMSGRDMELRWEADCQLPSNLINIFGSLRPAYRCLKNNEVLGVAIDGPGGKRKIELDWNGHQAVFSLGPMDLALRTGAAVLPIYTLREPSGRNILIIEQEITSSRKETSEDLTRAVVERHAAQALAHPSYYLEFMAWRRFMNMIDGTGLFVEYENSSWQKIF
ncbi:MAG: hypothetical protein D3906_09315 [Candidatus Electrothrix sp. AUS1_2]|nr:hypothetical protein [Candidatus Electrothrix sp. AUS1_2]